VRRLFSAFFLVFALLSAANWGSWNGVTVGASTGNVSSIDGKTIGTSSGNFGSWNGLTSPSASNTITLSQQLVGTSPANNCSAIFSNPLTCALPGTPTNGHFILLNVTASGTSCTISVSQTGVTWAAISGATTTTTGGMGFVWLGQVGSGASASATVTGTSCGNYAGEMVEFTCSPGPCAADGTPAVNSGSGTTYTSGTYTSSGTNELLFSALSLPGGGGSRCPIIVTPSGYTAANCNTDAGAGGVDTVGSAYLLTNSSGAHSGVNWSSVASLNYTNILLGIK